MTIELSTAPASDDHPPAAMREHELKTDRAVFEAVVCGHKPYEIRRDDRAFAVGETLWLRETVHTGLEMRDGAPLAYTGRDCRKAIMHVLRDSDYGVAEGFAILSLRRFE